MLVRFQPGLPFDSRCGARSPFDPELTVEGWFRPAGLSHSLSNERTSRMTVSGVELPNQQNSIPACPAKSAGRKRVGDTMLRFVLIADHALIPHMKAVSTLLLATGFIFLAGCAPAPQITEPVTTSSAAQNQAPTAIQRMKTLALPDDWERVETVESYAMAFSVKNDDIRDDSFIVRVLSGVCDQEFAQNEVKMNWGENVPAQYKPRILRVDGKPVGYTWSAFDGVAGGATEPRWIHWCIHQEESNMDIHISVVRSHEREKRFVEETFIPLWLQQNSES